MFWKVSVCAYLTLAATVLGTPRRPSRSCAFNLAQLAQNSHSFTDWDVYFKRLTESGLREFFPATFRSVDGVQQSELNRSSKKAEPSLVINRYYSHSDQGTPVEVSVTHSENSKEPNAANKRLLEVRAVNQILQRDGVQTLLLGWISGEKFRPEVLQNESAYPIPAHVMSQVGNAFIEIHRPDLTEIRPDSVAPQSLVTVVKDHRIRILNQIRQLETIFRRENWVGNDLTLSVSGNGDVFLGHLEGVFPSGTTKPNAPTDFARFRIFVEQLGQ